MEQTVLSINDDKMTTRGELIEYPSELIGGRNLILNSKVFQTGYSASGLSVSLTGEGYLQVVAEAENNNYVAAFMTPGYGALLNGGALKEGDLITVSMDAKSPNSTALPTLYLKDSLGYIRFKGTLSDKFSKISYTTTWKEANNVSFHLGFSGLVGTYIFKNIKLEKGNKATDWTPAPEDLGLFYPDWVTEFKPSISENGILIGSFTENPNL